MVPPVTFAALLKEMLRHVPMLFARTLLAFVTVLFVVRWTGKRSVANLAPFDLALVILIGEVAAIPVAEPDVGMIHGIFPVILIGILHVLMTTINMHSRRFEEFIEGKPTLLVKDGCVLKENLLQERVSMIDLQVALRQKEITRLAEVKEVWMEPGGGISVLKRDEPFAQSPSETSVDEALEQIVQAHADVVRKELQRRFREQQDRSGG